jgi:hypothetical protein
MKRTEPFTIKGHLTALNGTPKSMRGDEWTLAPGKGISVAEYKQKPATRSNK